MTTLETPPERTALAWQRTGLGVLAIAGLVGHRALEDSSAGLLVVAGVTALLALGVLGALAPVRYRDIQRRGTSTTAAPRLLAAVTAAVVLAALAAAIAILTPR